MLAALLSTSCPHWVPTCERLASLAATAVVEPFATECEDCAHSAGIEDHRRVWPNREGRVNHRSRARQRVRRIGPPSGRRLDPCSTVIVQRPVRSRPRPPGHRPHPITPPEPTSGLGKAGRPAIQLTTTGHAVLGSRTASPTGVRGGQSQSTGRDDLPADRGGRTDATTSRASPDNRPGLGGAVTADGLALVRRIAAADHFLAVLVTIDAAGAPQVSLVNAGV